MRTCARLTAALLALIASAPAGAEVRTLAHYSLKGAGGIRDTLCPDVLKDQSGNSPDLLRRGSPKVMTDAPAPRRREYDSAIAFEQADQCYQGPRPMAWGDHWLLEAWVRAARGADPGYHAVVANGNGGTGFLLCQKEDAWAVLVGGIGVTSLGKVRPDAWTHLAIVRDGPRAAGYVDGTKAASLPPPGGGAANFGIGATAPGKEPFRGWIAEVRAATFSPGRFDPAADFLLDPRTLQAISARERCARRRLVDALLAAPGADAVSQLDERSASADWLISPPSTRASVQVLANAPKTAARIMLSNGLVSRTFLVAGGNLGCISLRRSDKDVEFLRAIQPEARVRIDGGGWTEIGGLGGAPDRGFIAPRWFDSLESRPGAFVLAGMTVGEPVKPYAWEPKCNAPPAPWPAPGRRVSFRFVPPPDAADAVKDLAVNVHYEIYDGLPAMMKTMTVENRASRAIVVTQFEGERLAVQPTNSRMMHVESDYSFAAANFNEAGSALGIHTSGGDPKFKEYTFGAGTTRLVRDPEWGSMATLNPAEDLFLDNPENALLLSRPAVGPGWTVGPGQSFDAFRTFEILNDTTERERFHLAQRRFYKKLAPQTREHQFEVHAPVTRDLKVLGPLLDQMAELGFEMLQAPEHPGGFNYADCSPENIASIKPVCDYARSKGIRVKCYQLMMASQGWGRAEDRYNCISPATGRPGSLFGQSACGASAWADMYYARMWKTIEGAGLGGFAPDGPYHGDPCAAADHPHHKGLADSQWAQWMWMCGVLHEGQRRGLYLTVPDYYFLNGQVCTGMGYREAADNLDAVLQTVLYRQYIFDATWHKTAGMGWCNLNTEVLRGGMERNLGEYERMLFTLLSSGAQVWVRGLRLYDGPESRAMLRRWMTWYGKHRDVIQGDIIHLRRPDGRRLDYYLHVNPEGKEKGMLLVFNPTGQPVAQTLRVPLYYTGLTETARIRREEGEPVPYPLDRLYETQLPVTVPAQGATWFVIQ